MRTLLILLFSALLTACQSKTENEFSAASSDCTSSGSAIHSPQNIEQVVDLMNQLPRPLTVPCFLQSLNRPLQVYATESTSSVQPALDAKNPRLFIFSGPLLISTVVSGPNSDFLEFSVIKSTGQSLKGELRLPINSTIQHSLPYTRIRSGTGTSCSSCHSGEFQDPSINFSSAFVSKAIRPLNELKVSMSDLQLERTNCGNSLNIRCNMLRALFDHGPVVDSEFPDSIP